MDQKILYIGDVLTDGRYQKTFLKSKIKDGTLTISGVIGPQPSGNCAGSCGQIETTLYDAFAAHEIRFHQNFTPAMLSHLLDIWEKWHLNDMHAECEHQRALGWTYETHKGQECPTCGYKIGTEWKRVELPKDVITFMTSLPNSTVTPAWV
jgi:hypothetical protein